MTTKSCSRKDKGSLILRLRRIEGQVKGIQKMVDDDKDCQDILIQISAAKAALHKVGGLVLEEYIEECLVNQLKEGNQEDLLKNLLDLVVKYSK
jgi:DNA-binding FrmR family transcriptional regulator